MARKLPLSQRTGIKYKYIVAWGRYVGSKDYYIEDQLEKAEKENAPKRAISKAHDGTWRTMDAIEDPNLVAALEDYVKYLK